MIEYAFIIPIFLLLLMFLIDIGWITYQKVVFDHTCRHSAWDLMLKQDENWVLTNGQKIVRSGDYANRILEEQFCKVNYNTANHINIRNVSISNGEISIYPGEKRYKYKRPAEIPEELGMFTDINYKTTTLEIQGKIKYKIEPLTPLTKPFFKNGIELTNNLYKAKRNRMRARL